MVFRTYVEKRQGLAPECEALLTDCRDFLGVQGLRAARIWNRYDVEGIEAPLFENACRSVFSEPPLDLVSDAADTQDACAVFAVEPLPGQFDQRADSASQCIQLLSQGERPRIRTAKVYALYGTLTDADVEAVKRYVINPVESREASLAKPETLAEELAEPKCVSSVEGFTAMDEAALRQEMELSNAALAAATGQIPYVLCYPEGKYSHLTMDVAKDYYTFALRMDGWTYQTGMDPYQVPRSFVSRRITLPDYLWFLAPSGKAS